MRKYFITGLVTLLPLVVTLAVVTFVFNLLTGPFLGGVTATLETLGIMDGSVFSRQTARIICQVVILILLFVFTVLLGALTRWFFIHSLLHWGERIVQRIPFIRSVYKACKDVIKAIFTSETAAFKQVVMVPYPDPASYALGLVTREGLRGLHTKYDGELVAVFVPTTPNPTSGFLVMYHPEDLIYLDMKVEEAFKYIISCGVITTPFSYAPPKTKPSGNTVAEPGGVTA